MKKVVYLLALVLMVAVTDHSLAQCTPNSAQTAFVEPDTAVDFAPAYTYMAYSQVLYIAPPTNIPPLITQLDSLKIMSISGLPACITAAYNPANGVILGGGKACVLFSGTPATSDIGVYDLTINARYWGVFIGIPSPTDYPLTGYRIRILDSAYYSIEQVNPDFNFAVEQNVPNPFSKRTEITFISKGGENINLTVFDLLGNKVYDYNAVSVMGRNALYFDASEFDAGIYFYRLSNGKDTYTKRMILTNL